MVNIEEITGHFQAFDEKKLFYRKWVPKENPKKIVFVAFHGGAVNSKNMKYPGVHFSQKGYSFYALDQRGHGNCEEKDRGYVKNYDAYLQDIVDFAKFAKKEEKAEKIVLVGHSNGGGMVVAAAIKHKNIADYLILSAPTLRLYGSKFGLFVQEMLAYSLGTILPKLKFPHGIKPEELCWDQKVLKERSEDPYYWDKGTLRWVRSIFRFSKFGRRNLAKLETPALFMVPGEDKIVDAETTLKLFPKIKDKPGMKLNYYEGYLHELFNEAPDKKEKIFKDIEDYLKL